LCILAHAAPSQLSPQGGRFGAAIKWGLGASRGRGLKQNNHESGFSAQINSIHARLASLGRWQGDLGVLEIVSSEILIHNDIAFGRVSGG